MTNITIPLARPFIPDTVGPELASVLASGQLVAGERVARLESALASRIGVEHVICVSSGTGALMATLSALDVGPGSVVVVPAFTFPAPAMAAAFLGATVRLCDVDPETFNISEKTLLPVLDGGVSAVVAIDQFGAPAPVDEIQILCRKAGVPLLVDAACSLGASLNGQSCGSFGQAAVYSFHPRKVVTSGEGGAVLTNDEQLARRVRRLRNLGIGPGGFEQVGVNLRFSEMGAVMVHAQLEMLDELVAGRRRAAAAYEKLDLARQVVVSGGKTNYQTLAARLPDGFTGEDRAALISQLANCGVEAQVASYGLAQVAPLASRFGWRGEDVPVSTMLHQLGIALPMYYGLESAQVAQVCIQVNNCIFRKVTHG